MEEKADIFVSGLIQKILNDDGLRFRETLLKLNSKEKNYFEKIILENKISAIFLKFISKNDLVDLFTNSFIENCTFQQNRFQLHSLEIIKEVHHINKVFTKEGLTPIYIKGIALQNEYEDISLRPLVDIDVLFKESEILRAYELLHHNNLLNDKEKQHLNKNNLSHFFKYQHHIEVKTKNNISVELHHRVTKSNEKKFINCPISSQFFDDFRSINYHGMEINIPSIENTIIHQLCHFSLNNDFYGLLRTLTDINKLIYSYEVNWKDIILKYESKKIRKALCLSLDIFHLNKIQIKNFHKIKKKFPAYFPDKNILKEAQVKLYSGSNKKINGESLYSAIFGYGHDSIKDILKRTFFPNKEALIYKFKIQNPNKYKLLNIYLRYLCKQFFKIKNLLYLLITNFNSAHRKDAMLTKIWINED